ncbi:hypothetical protein OEG86_18790 [Hoeflea alexandrii]|uniref:hypothetical protein n=1 Tax=Hoeflea alexandrii TaxID=288436 RepID=UPI00227216A5|nr:hypothetical protein [Hoeflea alexandrii]MCY0153931.1 hypothetical protein [Hoeflea alexandrii]
MPASRHRLPLWRSRHRAAGMGEQALLFGQCLTVAVEPGFAVEQMLGTVLQVFETVAGGCFGVER